MLNYDEIQQEIERLEKGDTTYSAVEKLALLYIVRAHRDGEDRQESFQAYSYAAEPASSRFIQAAIEKPIERVLDVLDEHFEAIELLYPKEYEAVIQRLNGI